MRFIVSKSEPEGQRSQYMPKNFRFIAVGDESTADKSKHIYVLLKKDKPHLMSTDLKVIKAIYNTFPATSSQNISQEKTFLRRCFRLSHITSW